MKYTGFALRTVILPLLLLLCGCANAATPTAIEPIAPRPTALPVTADGGAVEITLALAGDFMLGRYVNEMIATNGALGIDEIDTLHTENHAIQLGF